MYTMENANLSPRNPTYHIPEDGTREIDREALIRATEARTMEKDVRGAHALRAKVVATFLKSVWRKLTGRASSAQKSFGTEFPA